MSIYNDTRCCDCKVETNHQKTAPAEWYMVNDNIWKLATLKKPANFLCIGCLEARIGRVLNKSDFKDVPLNHMSHYVYERSDRLISRMETECQA